MTPTTQAKHTLEPWLAQHSQICKGSLAVSDCFRAEDGSPEANARRIVACVNACVGFSTTELENKSRMQLMQALAKDRDELLEILYRLLEESHGYVSERAVNEARAALARLSK